MRTDGHPLGWQTGREHDRQSLLMLSVDPQRSRWRERGFATVFHLCNRSHTGLPSRAADEAPAGADISSDEGLKRAVLSFRVRRSPRFGTKRVRANEAIRTSSTPQRRRWSQAANNEYPLGAMEQGSQPAPTLLPLDELRRTANCSSHCQTHPTPLSPLPTPVTLFSSAHHCEHCDSLGHTATPSGGIINCWNGRGRRIFGLHTHCAAVFRTATCKKRRVRRDSRVSSQLLPRTTSPTPTPNQDATLSHRQQLLSRPVAFCPLHLRFPAAALAAGLP